MKQYTSVTYFGCELDQYLSGESMVTKVLGKINDRLKFPYRKQKFLGSSFRRIRCNSLIPISSILILKVKSLGKKFIEFN